MSAVVTGVVVGALSAGYGASESHKAKTTAGHAKKYARVKANQLSDQAAKNAAAAKASSLEDRRKRAVGVSRNLGLFSDSFGGMAQQARKTLMGQ